MRRKRTIISCLVTLGATVCVVASLRASEDASSTAADQYRQRATQALQDQAREMRARGDVWQSLPQSKQQQVMQSVQTKAERESAQMISAAEATPLEPCPFRGLLVPDREPAVPVPFHSWEFMVVNYWGGLLHGTCDGVYAGYTPGNPAQGELAVYAHPDRPSRYERYPSPAATGPLRIVSEKNGLLTLVSVAGVYPRATELDATALGDGSKPETVEVQGGVTYLFDLETLRYR